MSIGLEALKIFQAVASLDMREKYPIIYRNNIDSSCKFNPNIRHIYSVTSKPIIQTSPLFCFTLIPEKTITGESALNTSLNLLHFLNWAIYFYKIIHNDYNHLPKNRPKQNELFEVHCQTEALANMTENFTGKCYSEDEKQEKVNNTFKKNNFPLKPDYFLKLCRFFARGWYEEWFCTEESAVGSVEFAHYISNYIQNSLVTDNRYNCKRYDGNNKNHKKEVSKLFKDNNQIEYVYDSFHIMLERYNNKEKEPTYSISINQHCSHTFYLKSRLYLYRYTSQIK